MGTYPKEMTSLSQIDTCTPTFIVALFTLATTWKQPKCPSLDKENGCVCMKTNNGILFREEEEKEEGGGGGEKREGGGEEGGRRRRRRKS